VNASFSYRDSGNALRAATRKVGLFLREDGTAGLIQQNDRAV